MTRRDHLDTTDARRLLDRLRRTVDPSEAPNLLPGVLAAIGPGDQYALLDSPIGPLYITFNQIGVSAVVRASESIDFEREFRARHVRPIRKASMIPAPIRAALEAEFAGGPMPSLGFDLRDLSPFECAVLAKTREIPRGEVRPYAWIAREIGHPKAVRAVGTALGNNPVPLLIPCHRVLRSDGQIGGYALGVDTKRAVLEAEGAAPLILESLAHDGVRFLGDPEDGSFCLPSCSGMHKRADHFLKLHSPREALALGLEPCSTCRPIATH